MKLYIPDEWTGERRGVESLYALFDQSGCFCGMYSSEENADRDAAAPRFRRSYQIIEYVRKGLK